jgi:hypothetical protein
MKKTFENRYPKTLKQKIRKIKEKIKDLKNPYLNFYF